MAMANAAAGGKKKKSRKQKKKKQANGSAAPGPSNGRKGRRRARVRRGGRRSGIVDMARGAKVAMSQKITATLGTIGANETGGLEIEFATYFNPSLVKEQTSANAFTPLTVLAAQYARWRIASAKVIFTPLVGSSAVSGTAIRCSINLSPSANPASWGALGARLHTDVLIGHRHEWKLPIRELAGPMESWWVTNTNRPDQSLGPMLEVHSYGKTMSTYQGNAWTAGLFLLSFEATWEFASYSQQPALAGLAKHDAPNSTVHVSAVAGQPVELTMPAATSRFMERYNGVSPVGMRAGGTTTTADVIWMVLDTAVDVASQIVGPWKWLLKAGYWFVKKVFGRTTRAGEDVYYVYPSVDDAANNRPIMADSTSSYDVPNEKGNLSVVQINAPNIGSYGESSTAQYRMVAAPSTADFDPTAPFGVVGILEPAITTSLNSTQSPDIFLNPTNELQKQYGTIGESPSAQRQMLVPLSFAASIVGPDGGVRPWIVQNGFIHPWDVVYWSTGWSGHRAFSTSGDTWQPSGVWLRFSVGGALGYTKPAGWAGTVFLCDVATVDDQATNAANRLAYLRADMAGNGQSTHAALSWQVMTLQNAKASWVGNRTGPALIWSIGRTGNNNHQKTLEWGGREIPLAPGPAANKTNDQNFTDMGGPAMSLLDALGLPVAGSMGFCLQGFFPAAPTLTVTTTTSTKGEVPWESDLPPAKEKIASTRRGAICPVESDDEPSDRDTEESELSDEDSDYGIYYGPTTQGPEPVEEGVSPECEDCGRSIRKACCGTHTCDSLPCQDYGCLAKEGTCPENHEALEGLTCLQLKLLFHVLRRMVYSTVPDRWPGWKDYYNHVDQLRPKHSLAAAFVIAAHHNPPPGYCVARQTGLAMEGTGVTFRQAVKAALAAANSVDQQSETTEL